MSANATFASRVGEQRRATNGQMMTILKYTNFRNLVIQFEDGTLITTSNYHNFCNGNIRNPNYNPSSKLGETQISTAGQKMTVTKYITSKDISVTFEDGTTVDHVGYSNFKLGRVKNPNYDNRKLRNERYHNSTIDLFKKKYIGQSNMMNCGMKATIIDYASANDIDVKFEDGYVVKHTTIGIFKQGSIANKNIASAQSYKKKLKYLNMTKMMSCGREARITSYVTNKDIEVTFDDGTIVKHKGIKEFLNGNIGYPLYLKYTDEPFYCQNGLKASIIEYINQNRIKVLFEDGTKVTTNARCYKDKSIRFPNFNMGSQNNKAQFLNFTLESLAYIESSGRGNFVCTCNKCGHRDIFNSDEMKNHICSK